MAPTLAGWQARAASRSRVPWAYGPCWRAYRLRPVGRLGGRPGTTFCKRRRPPQIQLPQEPKKIDLRSSISNEANLIVHSTVFQPTGSIFRLCN